MNNKLINHYAVYKAFNDRIYNKTLTEENISNSGGQKYVDVVHKLDMKGETVNGIEEDKSINAKCVFMEKSGIKYILPSKYTKHLPLNPTQTFDCYLKASDKTIYKFIESINSVKITEEKTIPFKLFIDEVFNNLEHSDEKTWKFLKIQSIASKYKGGKYRLCSPPSSGKNANDVILHMIFGGTVRVSKPTIAKLETLYYYNQKVLPDEMTSLTPTQVREVEPFFLQLADESPTFTKHSMAQKKDLNEVDISNSSCVFTYNDIDSLQEDSKFFDDIWQNKAAFNSRYPAMLIDGVIISNMPKLSGLQASKIMEENFDKLRIIARNLSYYIFNMSKELKGYDRSKICLKGRQLSNFECVLDTLDVYCDTQLEYDEWLFWVNEKINNYKSMVSKTYYSNGS